MTKNIMILALVILLVFTGMFIAVQQKKISYLEYEAKLTREQYSEQHKNTVAEYEQNYRVQWEYLKACEARMTYLDSVLESEGITVLK